MPNQDPASHPAVVVPRRALATAAVLNAPRVLAQNTAFVPMRPRLEAETLRLHSLYPGGEMRKVNVYDYGDNPNPIVKQFGYGDWTNSVTLIYLSTDDNDWVLYHEGQHILQFQQNGGVPPVTFRDMLRFETLAGIATRDWAEKRQVPDKKALLEELNEQVARNDSIWARALLYRLASFRQNDSCFQDALIDFEYLPKLKTEKRYLAKDMYDPVNANNRWKALGY